MLVHHTVRGFLRLIGAVFLSMLVLIGWLTIQLDKKPLSLIFLIPIIEKALSSPENNINVHIGKVILKWDDNNHLIELRTLQGGVFAEDNKIVAELPDMSINFSLQELKHFHIAIKSIRFLYPTIRLTRKNDGAFHLAMNTDNFDTQLSPDLTQILKIIFFSEQAEGSQIWKRVDVQNGTLILEDDVTGLSQQIPNIQISLFRDVNEIIANTDLSFQSSEKISKIHMTNRLKTNDTRIQTHLIFDDISSDFLSLLSPKKELFQNIHMFFSGDFETTYKFENGITLASLSLRGQNDSKNTILAFDKITFPTDNLGIKANYLGESDSVMIENFQLECAEAKVIFQAQIDNFSSLFNDKIEKVIHSNKSKDLSLKANITIQNILMSSLPSLWPSSLAIDTRNWILENMKTGVIHEANFSFKGTLSDGKSPENFNISELTGTMNADHLAVQFLHPMPLITDLTLSAHYDLNKFNIQLINGKINNLLVPESNISIVGLSDDQQYATILVNVEGNLSNVIELIDSPPLKWADYFHINPKSFSGLTHIELGFHFPLLNDLTFNQLKITKATLSGEHINISDLPAGLEIQNSTLNGSFSRTGMVIEGQGLIKDDTTKFMWHENFNDNPIKRHLILTIPMRNDLRNQLGEWFLPPYLDGTVITDLDILGYENGLSDITFNADLSHTNIHLSPLNYIKKLNDKAWASGHLTLKNNDIHDISLFQITDENSTNIKGSAHFENEYLSELVLEKAQWGKSDFKGKLTKPSKSSPTFLNIHGQSFDAREILSSSKEESSSSTSSESNSLPLHIQANFDHVWFSDYDYVKNNRFSMFQNHNIIQTMDYEGMSNLSKKIHMAINYSKSNIRQFNLESEDAGEACHIFDISDHIIGGTLAISGQFDDTNSYHRLSGEAQISDYYLSRAPILARLLSLSALTDIVDELNGNGIHFNHLNLPFTFAENIFSINDARANGSALGLTARGDINLSKEKIALEGTIIPIYVLNGFFNETPFLNNIFSPEKGGGLVAMGYSVTGLSSDPDINLYPFTALTPGFLRKFFDLFKDTTSPKLLN